jgi:hypothetical protein
MSQTSVRKRTSLAIIEKEHGTRRKAQTPPATRVMEETPVVNYVTESYYWGLLDREGTPAYGVLQVDSTAAERKRNAVLPRAQCVLWGLLQHEEAIFIASLANRLQCIVDKKRLQTFHYVAIGRPPVQLTLPASNGDIPLQFQVPEDLVLTNSVEWREEMQRQMTENWGLELDEEASELEKIFGTKFKEIVTGLLPAERSKYAVTKAGKDARALAAMAVKAIIPSPWTKAKLKALKKSLPYGHLWEGTLHPVIKKEAEAYIEHWKEMAAQRKAGNAIFRVHMQRIADGQLPQSMIDEPPTPTRLTNPGYGKTAAEEAVEPMEVTPYAPSGSGNRGGGGDQEDDASSAVTNLGEDDSEGSFQEDPEQEEEGSLPEEEEEEEGDDDDMEVVDEEQPDFDD